MSINDWNKDDRKRFGFGKFASGEVVTKEMLIASARKQLVLRGSVRLMSGRLSTSGEIEERRSLASLPLD